MSGEGPANRCYVGPVEVALVGHDHLRLHPEWRTEKGVTVDITSLPEGTNAYRHIMAHNSTYGLVPEKGPVQLGLHFVPVSGRGREAVPESIRTYTSLIAALSKYSIPYSPDADLEDAIDGF